MRRTYHYAVLAAGLMATAGMGSGCQSAPTDWRETDKGLTTRTTPPTADEYSTYFRSGALSNQDILELYIWAADQIINQQRSLPGDFLYGLENSIPQRTGKQPDFLRNSLYELQGIKVFNRDYGNPTIIQPELYFSQQIFRAATLVLADHWLEFAVQNMDIVQAAIKDDNDKRNAIIEKFLHNYGEKGDAYLEKITAKIPGNLTPEQKTLIALMALNVTLPQRMMPFAATPTAQDLAKFGIDPATGVFIINLPEAGKGIFYLDQSGQLQCRTEENGKITDNEMTPERRKMALRIWAIHCAGVRIQEAMPPMLAHAVQPPTNIHPRFLPNSIRPGPANDRADTFVPAQFNPATAQGRNGGRPR
jgi:hypothetical protein